MDMVIALFMNDKKRERTEKGLFNLSISINKAMKIIRARRVGSS